MGEFEQDRAEDVPQKLPVLLVHGELDGQEPKKFDFEKYREVIDAHTEGSRKLGLQDSTNAEQSLKDPRTITVEIDGMNLPALVPIEYVDGYDTMRTKQIAEQTGGNPQEVYYFSLPPDLLSGEEKAKFIATLKDQKLNEMFVFFEYDESTLDTKNAFEEIVSELNREVSSVPLADTAVHSPENWQASLALYAASSQPKPEMITREGPRSIYEAYQAAIETGEYEKIPDNGPTLLKGSEIDASLRDKMWDIYSNRFKDLGEFHPITMEDTREGFEAMLDDPNTIASINFRDGEPKCWMTLMSSIESCHWLNAKFFSSENLHRTEDEELLFFPEVVARADDVGGYSEATVQIAAKMLARTNKKHKIVFESTNRSGEYIPTIVVKYANDTGELQVAPAEIVDKTMYACYRIE